MNFIERKNLGFRLAAVFAILLNLGFDIFAFIYIYKFANENKILSMIACLFAALLMIFESVLLLMGGKKESALYKIAFNPNGRLNNVPFFGVLIFTFFGVGLTILGIILNVVTHYEPNVSISFIILVVSAYLLTKCLIYEFYCLLFKNRKIKLEDFIK